jgi:hypothetical protein
MGSRRRYVHFFQSPIKFFYKAWIFQVICKISVVDPFMRTISKTLEASFLPNT